MEIKDSFTPISIEKIV